MARDPQTPKVGDRIRLLRERIGISQTDLGKRTGVTPAAVAQWESGLSTPSPRRLAPLSKALGAYIDWLITGRGPPTPPATVAGATTTAVQLDAKLVNEAHELDIDLAPRLEDRLLELLAEARRRRWLDENRGALQDANAFLARHGLWSDGRRQF